VGINDRDERTRSLLRSSFSHGDSAAVAKPDAVKDENAAIGIRDLRWPL
jgi:hypothetical protein